MTAHEGEAPVETARAAVGLLADPVPLAAVMRGGEAESVHLGWAVVVDGGGRVVRRWGGDPVVLGRSSLKPLQALPLLATGAAAALGLGSEDLAIACASHAGTPAHLAAVRGLLGRARVPEAALACAGRPPLDAAAADALAATGLAPRPVHANCSGKHAGFLALCRHAGWPLVGYLDPDHPCQRAVRAAVAEAAGLAPEALTHAIDGCGAPTWRLPLAALARGFAALPHRGEPLVAAMRTHPELVSGEGRFDTALMRAARGAVVGKGGAEAVHAGAWPEAGLAWAVKVLDGNRRAVPVAVLAVLSAVGAIAPTPELSPWASPPVRSDAGEVVGAIQPLI